ncbi:prepilin peptidase [Thermoproteota archaeon]
MFIELIFIILLGMAAGSTANALIYRLPRDISFAKGRSKCPSCEHNLSVFELIPVFSYLIQMGHCRHCRSRIPIRYLLCEISAIVMAVITWYFFGFSYQFVKIYIFLFAMLILFFTDLETYILPNEITYPLIFTGFGIALLEHQFLNSFYGFCAAGFTYFLIGLIAKWYYKTDAMGFGDVKLGAGIGAYWGLQTAVLTCYFSFIFGGLIGLIYLLSKKKTLKDHVPFAPAIILGCITSLIIGNQIWLYYFGV